MAEKLHEQSKVLQITSANHNQIEMKLTFKTLLFIATLTTLTALLMSFVALPDNSGYAGLFFMAISPLFIFVFMIWTLFLAAINQKAVFRKLAVTLLLTLIFEYLAAVVTMWTMSSDAPGYDMQDFLSDSAALFGDSTIFFCMLTVALVYTLLVKYKTQTTENPYPIL